MAGGAWGAHSMLLSNADVKGAVRVAGGEAVHARAAAHGGVDAHDAGVPVRLCQQSVRKHVRVRGCLHCHAVPARLRERSAPASNAAQESNAEELPERGMRYRRTMACWCSSQDCSKRAAAALKSFCPCTWASSKTLSFNHHNASARTHLCRLCGWQDSTKQGIA